MLFRPKFCANCGEKIERVDWHVWTSRRFCEVCETDFKLQDLIPRAVIAVGALGLAVTAFGFFKGGASAADTRLVKQQAVADKSKIDSPSPKLKSEQIDTNTASPANMSSRTLVSLSAPPKPTGKVETTIAEPVFICGAVTKKGKPCSRRVKGNVRCFQHTGMPAMLPPDKLRVS